MTTSFKPCASLWHVIHFALLILCLAVCLAVFLTRPARAGDGRYTNTIGMTFIRIEPGHFFMGSPVTERLRDQDETLHERTITSAYYLQETEVTLAQWRAVMGKRWLMHRWLMHKKGSEKMPVTRVSWYDCIKFIEKLNTMGQGTYRLPTEAEWEYACRAGTTTAYSWGEGIDCSKALYGNNTKKDSECISYLECMNIHPNGPAPVKTYAPNSWGLYDMHGNVWEWCQDKYTDYLASPADKAIPDMDAGSRVRRGGSWYKHAHYLRSANRTYAHPAAKFKTTGFRLVLEAK